MPSMETDHILLPLGESTLINNIGLPIVVVITKVEIFSTGMKFQPKICLKMLRFCQSFKVERIESFPDLTLT